MNIRTTYRQRAGITVLVRSIVLLLLLLTATAGWGQSLTDEAGQTAFQSLADELGLNRDTTDYSSSDAISIDEPRLAYVNITGITAMPTDKRTTRKGWLEAYDGNGLYFKKPVTITGQGGYSMRFPKRNFTCHFCDSLWNEDGGADFVIGGWVEQDAFHFKAFYTDYIRGIGEVGYKLFDYVVADRRPYWERCGYDKASIARCYPDAFPCIVYFNGEFYGLFAWQLKKHRKNMNQKKTVAEHVHLDGNLRDDYIFRGKISWGQFEVRNPKDLYTKNGSPYNGNSPMELIDESSASYYKDTDSDSIREAKQRTAQVKKYIIKLSNHYNELASMERSGATAEEMREAVEERYDIEGLLDYAVFFYFSQNGDGSLKNWQWFTYDGRKWTVTPYDLDQIFGVGLYGNLRPPTLAMEPLRSGPFIWIDRYYQDDIRRRYVELRENGTLNRDTINGIIDSWVERIGQRFYDMEKELWNESPCYCDAICNDGWERCDDWSLYADTEEYNKMRQYYSGDVCKLEGKLWRATQPVQGVKPFIRNANIDSMERIYGWVDGRIEYLDSIFCYGSYEDGIRDIAVGNAKDRPQNPTLTSQTAPGIYTLNGIKLSAPLKGEVNVFRYSDGTSRKVRVR